MSLICAWCGAWIRKERPVGAISHGICKSCAEKLTFDDDGKAERPCTTH
jgi:predicted amidophosphoribosyltransferase